MTPAADHPEEDLGAVVDWLEERLDPGAAADVERLVQAGDPDVLATVAWWRRFHAAALLPTEPVPDELAARLRAMTPSAQEAGSANDPSRLGRFVGAVRAVLSFDSRQTPGLAMARSTSDGTGQLVFSGPGLDVAVDVSEPYEDTMTAAAQLLPLDDDADPADVPVHIWARTGLVGRHRSDPSGRVELGALPTGVLVMEVDPTPSWPAVHAELDLRRPG